ncbi:hypothetical protein QAD02_010727 [Eretmocerus hayati]|uniref:Uncharacterized protein n=1 Tax=Eretmocerus hayati TaxID=131215 RepID=A0ACC2NVV6_9HYME|nr:hypothetical protein QAD02_010727 [Eretmocerus hayati]
MTQLSHGEDLTLIPNEYYCPRLKNNLYYLFAQFPAWTNVMNAAYDTTDAAISACSETMFKNYDLMTYMTFPVSSNRFVLGGIQTVNGMIKLSEAAMKNNKLLMKNAMSKNISENLEQMNEKLVQFPRVKPKEQARDKNNKRKKPTHVSLATARPIQAQPPSSNPIVLKNGLRQGAKHIFGVSRRYTNTCAFDSHTEVLATAAPYYHGVMAFLQRRRDSEYIQKVLQYVNDDNYTADHMYYDRNRLLHPLAWKMDDVEVDCRIALPDLIVSLIRVAGAEELIIRDSMCLCGHFSMNVADLMIMTHDVASLIFDDPENGLDHLQDCADMYFNSKNRNCQDCNSPKWTKKYMNSTLLMIDVQNVFVNEGNSLIKSTPPNTLKIDGTEYELFGLAECIVGGQLLHYIAHIEVDDKWLKKDDLRNGVTENNELKFLFCIM